MSGIRRIGERRLTDVIPARESAVSTSADAETVGWIAKPSKVAGHQNVSLDASQRVKLSKVGLGNAELTAQSAKYYDKLFVDYWRGFEKFGRENPNNILPDNITLKKVGEDLAVTHKDNRGQPTTAGLQLLMTGLAHRRNLISSAELVKSLNDTLDSIDRMPRHEFNLTGPDGKVRHVRNMFNWYGTAGDGPEEMPGRFVSTADLGNYMAMATATAQLVKSVDPKLSQRLLDTVREMDLGVLYNKKTGLFFHGAAFEDGKLVPSSGEYDLRASEAAIAVIMASLLKQAPRNALSKMALNLGKNPHEENFDPNKDISSSGGTAMEWLLQLALFPWQESPVMKAMAEKAAQAQLADVEPSTGLAGRTESGAALASPYEYHAFGAQTLAHFPVPTDAEGKRLEVLSPHAMSMVGMVKPLEAHQVLQRFDRMGAATPYGHVESGLVQEVNGGKEFVPHSKIYPLHAGFGGLATAVTLDPTLNRLILDSELNQGGELERLLQTPLSAHRKQPPKRVQGVSPQPSYEPAYPKGHIIGSGNLVTDARTPYGLTMKGSDFDAWQGPFLYAKDKSTGQVVSLTEPDKSTPTASGGMRYHYDLKYPSGRALSVTLDISLGNGAKRTQVTLENPDVKPLELQLSALVPFIMDHGNRALEHQALSRLGVIPQIDKDLGFVAAQRRGHGHPFVYAGIEGRDGAKVDWLDGSRQNIEGPGGLALPDAVLNGTAGGKDGTVLEAEGGIAKTVTLPARGRATLALLVGMTDDAARIPQLLGRGPAGRAIEQTPPAPVEYPSKEAYDRMVELGRRHQLELKMRTGAIAPSPRPASQAFEWLEDDSILLHDLGAILRSPRPWWPNVFTNGVEKGPNQMVSVWTASGGGYLAVGNAQKNQVVAANQGISSHTPPRGVVFRDSLTHEEFSATADPAPSKNMKHEVRVAPDFNQYIARGKELTVSQKVFPVQGKPAEVWEVEIANTGEERTLDVESWANWAMAENAVDFGRTQTTFDAENGALLAENGRSRYKGARGFLALVTDGRGKVEEGSKFGLPGVKTQVVVPKNGSVKLAFVLGQARRPEQVKEILSGLRTTEQTTKVLADAVNARTQRPDKLKVHTPAPWLDRMVNHWLVKGLETRVLGRAAFQISGAWGGRDQTQDKDNWNGNGEAFTQEMSAKHIVDLAEHQFEEGDVHAWWHERDAAGLSLSQRSRKSDIAGWLPLMVARHVELSGSDEILKQEAGFAEGPKLEPWEADRMASMGVTEGKASIKEHSYRAIDSMLSRLGEHGIPLIGTGDWNDGFNGIGPKGRGESVWMGFFLGKALKDFIPIARAQGDEAVARRYESELAKLKENLERYAWDEDKGYYKRAITDDGEWLDHCDAIVQGWAMKSGIANPERAKRAVNRAAELLHMPEHNLLQLANITFDGKKWAGHLGDYPPYEREAGQYTHGDLWLVEGMAMSGDGDRALELLKTAMPTVHAERDGYGAEPWGVPADLRTDPKKDTGRAGWTQYTGSNGMLYRLIREVFLGIQFKGGRLFVNPTISKAWPRFDFEYKNYKVEVTNPDHVSTGVARVLVDGKELDALQFVDHGLQLTDEGEHHLEIVMGRAASTGV